MGGWAAFLLFFLRANYAHIFALRTISAARGESAAAVGGAAALCTPFRRRSRSARFAAGALGSAQLFGRGVLPRLFFSNSRPQNRGAVLGLLPPRKGAAGRALFLPRRLWEKRRDPVFKPQGNSIIPNRKFVTTFQKKRAPAGAAVGGALHALSAALSLRSVRRRGAAIFRRRVFAHKAFSLSGICARRN